MFSPNLVTERLILRQYKEKDIDVLYEIITDKRLSKYIKFPNITKNEELDYIKNCIKEASESPYEKWVIERKSDGVKQKTRLPDAALTYENTLLDAGRKRVPAFNANRIITLNRRIWDYRHQYKKRWHLSTAQVGDPTQANLCLLTDIRKLT
jgi:hypothetical protein